MKSDPGESVRTVGAGARHAGAFGRGATSKDWVERGAAIHVCGGPHRMAGVHEALRELLEDETLERLGAERRCRRDVDWTPCGGSHRQTGSLTYGINS